MKLQSQISQSLTVALIGVFFWCNLSLAYSHDLRSGSKHRVSQIQKSNEIVLSSVQTLLKSNKYEGSQSSESYLSDLKLGLSQASDQIQSMSDAEIGAELANMEHTIKANKDEKGMKVLTSITSGGLVSAKERLISIIESKQAAFIENAAIAIQKAGSVTKMLQKEASKLQSKNHYYYNPYYYGCGAVVVVSTAYVSVVLFVIFLVFALALVGWAYSTSY